MIDRNVFVNKLMIIILQEPQRLCKMRENGREAYKKASLFVYKGIKL